MKKLHPEYFLKATKTTLDKNNEMYSATPKVLTVSFRKELAFLFFKFLRINEVDDASYTAGNSLYNNINI